MQVFFGLSSGECCGFELARACNYTAHKFLQLCFLNVVSCSGRCSKFELARAGEGGLCCGTCDMEHTCWAAQDVQHVCADKTNRLRH